MQEVIGGLAGVIVADQEHEGAPDSIEDRLDVPAHVDQQHAQPNPAHRTQHHSHICNRHAVFTLITCTVANAFGGEPSMHTSWKQAAGERASCD